MNYHDTTNTVNKMEESKSPKGVDRHFLASVPATKEDLRNLATNIVTSVLDGDKNSLETDIQLRYLAELVDMIRKHSLFKKSTMNEADKYTEKSFDAYGATITKTSRATYSYEACGDPVWDDLVKLIAELNDQRKRREKFLQTLDGDTQVVDEETGAVILPPLKESQDLLRVTLK